VPRGAVEGERYHSSGMTTSTARGPQGSLGDGEEPAVSKLVDLVAPLHDESVVGCDDEARAGVTQQVEYGAVSSSPSALVARRAGRSRGSLRGRARAPLFPSRLARARPTSSRVRRRSRERQVEWGIAGAVPAMRTTSRAKPS